MTVPNYLKSYPMYDMHLRAKIIPWTHHFNSWVGYYYQFDDEERPNRLIYFVPIEGRMTYHVHYTEANVLPNSGLQFEVEPDPETDRKVATLALGFD